MGTCLSETEGTGYRLYEPLAESELGRILIGEKEYWIYEGNALGLQEQEEIAAAILGHQTEMAAFLRKLHEYSY
jgi:hypothetical protein